VALGKPYNETADSYSFAILCWQMFAIETPYEGYNVNMFEKSVIKGGARPKVEDKVGEWGKSVSGFITDCFVDNPNRPSMLEATELLRGEINNRSDEEITDILDTSRKSQLSAA
jgi:hypothetical protein